jgi:hypothetical protein
MDALLNHLHADDLLTNELKASIVKHYEQLEQEAQIKAAENAENAKNSKKFTYGKYKGKAISDVAKLDHAYLQWSLKQPWIFADIKKEIEKYIE